jgi:hypothetical protein
MNWLMHRRAFADQGAEYATMHMHRASYVSGDAAGHVNRQWKCLHGRIRIWPDASDQTANIPDA